MPPIHLVGRETTFVHQFAPLLEGFSNGCMPALCVVQIFGAFVPSLHVCSTILEWCLALHTDVTLFSSIQDLWEGTELHKVRSTVVIATLWNIWKWHNAKIFRDFVESVPQVFKCCASDLALRSHRCVDEICKSLLMDSSARFANSAASVEPQLANVSEQVI
jgi:hypothetical protein